MHSFGGSLTDSPRGKYRNGTDSFVTTRAIDLRQRKSCEVDFFLLPKLARGGDRLLVQASKRRGHWRTLRTFSRPGKGDFHFIRMPGRFAGASAAHVRFLLHTNATGRGDGVYIDDLQVTCITTAPSYAFADGTSFAAPQVAGAAGLLYARAPGSSVAQVKAKLLASVRRFPWLAGKLVSGGVLDVNAALR